jgi:putative restriction endonuclease
MKMKIGTTEFEVLGTYGPVTIADSFVVVQNKIGSGKGEAKLYVGSDGSDGSEVRTFFGTPPVQAHCFLLRSDLDSYLKDTAAEYRLPEQPYRASAEMPQLLAKRRVMVSGLPELIEFSVTEQTQIAGRRVFLNSSDAHYKLLRELSLPNLTKVMVVKLLDPSGRIRLYFRLFADFFGETDHPAKQAQEESRIATTVVDGKTREALTTSRVGQGQFRKDVLADCGRCPITLIADERLLIASHIKPWVDSNDTEKLDPKNGLMLTPTYDRLFDQGFISFTDDRKVILSPWIPKTIYAQLRLFDGKRIPHLPISGREVYMEHHRRYRLKR